MKKKAWHQSVIYQIYPKSFKDTTGNGIGDLQGIISKLDYLELLGVDVLWLSPVYQSPMKDNGYDISDYRAISSLFGNMDDMDALISEASRHGIRIMMDLVVNHVSDQHPWFQSAISSKNSPYRDYFIWRSEANDMKSAFGGSAWAYDETSDAYYYHSFAKEQPDLNWKNEGVVRAIYDMMNWWIDKGIGGFRMDVIDHISKDVDEKIPFNGVDLHAYLQRMNQHTFGGRDFLTVGESWNVTPETGILYSNPDRHELNMIFQFEHMMLDWGEHGKWTPKPLDLVELKSVLSNWQISINECGWNSLFWNNHDLPRIVSRWGNDQAFRVESGKMLAILLHFMKGTPYIYQGEEIGMTNVRFESLEDYDDVEIHGNYKELVLNKGKMTHDDFMEGVYAHGRDNGRTPMQWDGTINAGFTSGIPWLQVNPNYKDINVDHAINDSNAIFSTYQKLIQLRKDSEWSDVMVYGKYEVLFPDHKDLFCYQRTYEDRQLVILTNFRDVAVDLPEAICGQGLVIGNYEDTGSLECKSLNPYEALVYNRSIHLDS